MLTSELHEVKSIAEERSITMQTLQDQLDDLRTSPSHPTAEATSSSSDENTWSILRNELTHLTSHLRTLESQNAKQTIELNGLRERNTSIEVLKEEKRGLERKLKGMEELREKVVRLEGELDAGRREREEWYVSNPIHCSRRPNLSLFQGQEIIRREHVTIKSTPDFNNPIPLRPPPNTRFPSRRTRFPPIPAQITRSTAHNTAST